MGFVGCGFLFSSRLNRAGTRRAAEGEGDHHDGDGAGCGVTSNVTVQSPTRMGPKATEKKKREMSEIGSCPRANAGGLGVVRVRWPPFRLGI